MTAAVLTGGLYLPPEADVDLLPYRRPNPAHALWEAMDRRARGPEPARWVASARKLPAGHPWHKGYALPRFDTRGHRPTHDRTTAPPADVLDQAATLRDYQRAAVSTWTRHGDGVLQLPCGAGKTTIAVAAVATTPAPALILTHTLDLQDQWASRIRRDLGVEAALIGDGRRDAPARVTLASIQTLATWDWWERVEWGRAFGLLVIDEAHHVPARTYVDVVLTMPARRRLALTATPERADGLTDWLFAHLGPMRVEVPQSLLQRLGFVLVPELREVETGWTPSGRAPSEAATRRQRRDDERRNALVASQVAQLVDEGHQVIVLAEELSHVALLANLTGGVALTGELPREERLAVLARAAQGPGRVPVLVATSVADEGLDLPTLSAAVFAVPSGNRARVEQRAGRVLRPHPGKRSPVILDLVDADDKALSNRRSREIVYRRLNAERR